MAEFLSADWFRTINEALANAVTDAASSWRVVFEWADGPSSQTHAMTLSCVKGKSEISAGDHIAADALVTMSYADANSLANGTLDVAEALRTGRFKVRGDARAVIDMANALRAAFA